MPMTGGRVAESAGSVTNAERTGEQCCSRERDSPCRRSPVLPGMLRRSAYDVAQVELMVAELTASARVVAGFGRRCSLIELSRCWSGRVLGYGGERVRYVSPPGAGI